MKSHNNFIITMDLRSVNPAGSRERFTELLRYQDLQCGMIYSVKIQKEDVKTDDSITGN